MILYVCRDTGYNVPDTKRPVRCLEISGTGYHVTQLHTLRQSNPQHHRCDILTTHTILSYSNYDMYDYNDGFVTDNNNDDNNDDDDDIIVILLCSSISL
jgi:hypothetical protein